MMIALANMFAYPYPLAETVYLKVTTVSLTEHSRVDITIRCVHEKHIFKPGPLNLKITFR